MRRLRALLLSSLAAAPAVLVAACAPALDFNGLTGGEPKTDASGDGTVDAPEDEGSAVDAAADSPSPVDAAIDSPRDAPSSADAVDAIEEYAADPCAKVPSLDNGVYCGKSVENNFCCGLPNTLYTCVDGGVSARMACTPDCVTDPMGYPDTCDECSLKPDGKWCGSEFIGYDPLLKNVVFTCQGGVDIDVPTPTACSGAQPNCKPNDGGATCMP
jgi:hypothetical protein